jgi:GTPase SAR1 family protein
MKGYQAHESFWADTKMFANLIGRALLVGLIAQLLILYLLADPIAAAVKNIYISNSDVKLPPSVGFKYLTGDFLNIGVVLEPEIRQYVSGYKKLPIRLYRFFADRLTNNAYRKLSQKIKQLFLRSLSGYLITLVYIIFFFARSRKMESEKFIRGVQLTPLNRLNEQLTKEARKSKLSALHIGDTWIPFGMEPKHTLILGTSGSGKTVLLHQFVAQLNQRKYFHQTGERCVFYDLKGEFIEKHLNRQDDYIFSPFDERSVQWRFFNEIETFPDYDVVSKSLYVSDKKENEYFYDCAKDIFRTGLRCLKRQGRTSNRDIWNFFAQSLEEMKTEFLRLPLVEQGAIKHIDKSDNNTSAVIVSVLQQRIEFFKYLIEMDGDFSFKKFIRGQKVDPNGAVRPNPNLFILNIEQYKSIFKPLMTLAIDTIIRETLSLSDSRERRIFFIVDELGSLYRLDSIIDLLTVGRSKGACLICANQDLGRLEEIYGKPNVRTIFNNFNTNIIFRIREPETAEFLSKSIGERQVIKRAVSRQMSPSDLGDRKNIADQEKTKKLIIPTELQGQRDLQAVINIANFGISKIEVPPLFYKVRYSNFTMRKFSEDFEYPQSDLDEAGATVYFEAAPAKAKSETQGPDIMGFLG